MKHCYINNVKCSLIKANSKSLKSAKSGAPGYSLAWDNVKAKNVKRYLPRGKVFQRLDSLNALKYYNETLALVKQYQSQ